MYGLSYGYEAACFCSPRAAGSVAYCCDKSLVVREGLVEPAVLVIVMVGEVAAPCSSCRGHGELWSHAISHPLVFSSCTVSPEELWLTAAKELLSQLNNSLKLVSVVFLGGLPRWGYLLS